MDICTKGGYILKKKKEGDVRETLKCKQKALAQPTLIPIRCFCRIIIKAVNTSAAKIAHIQKALSKFGVLSRVVVEIKQIPEDPESGDEMSTSVFGVEGDVGGVGGVDGSSAALGLIIVD